MIAKDLVKDITITAGDKPGTQKVVFKANRDTVTKEEAIKAIGDRKDVYVVTKLTKQTDDEKDEDEKEKDKDS